MTKNSCPKCKKSKQVLEILFSKPFWISFEQPFENQKNFYFRSELSYVLSWQHYTIVIYFCVLKLMSCVRTVAWVFSWTPGFLQRLLCLTNSGILHTDMPSSLNSKLIYWKWLLVFFSLATISGRLRKLVHMLTCKNHLTKFIVNTAFPGPQLV